ncbi:BatD family protein [bacterium]|nr:BatD family protein [bacterium]
MRRNSTWLWILGLVLITALGAKAHAKVTVYAEPSPVVVGDTFRYVIQADSRIDDATLPEIQGGNVRLAGGPNSSSSTLNVNGRQSVSVEMSWTFQAQGTGTVKFGPAKVIIGGNTVQTNPVEVEVIPVPSQKLGTFGEVSSARTGNTSLDQQLKGRLFSYTEVPDKVYANQAFQATTYLYRRANFNPSIAGINVLEVAGGRQFIRVDDASYRVPGIQWESVNVDGEAFLRTPLAVSTMVPTRAGETTLRGTTFQMILQTANNTRRRDPFFDSFFNRNTVEAQLPAYEQELNILPLPPKPDGVLGQLVGSYQITSFADKSELTESDLLTLTIRVSGTGYLQTVSMESLPEFDGFTKINEEVDFQINNIHGDLVTTKVFKEILQASKPGEFEIPPLDFAVFDPKTEEQKIVSTNAIPVTILQSKGSSLQLASGSPTRARGEVREVGQADILFIDTEPLRDLRLRSDDAPFYARPWYWVLHGGALLLVVAAVSWVANVRRLHADPVAYHAKRADRRAQEALREAEKVKGQGTREEYYSALAQGILNRVAAITGRQASGLTADDALKELRSQGVEEDDLTRLSQLLDRCDAMRYAPESADNDREKDLQGARALITELGKGKKR